jgi:phosphate transport system substrate-binding protein
MNKVSLRSPWSLALAAAVAWISVGSSHARDETSIPGYRPEQTVSGTIRIWGDEHMADVTKYWAEGFRKFHPQIKF